MAELRRETSAYDTEMSADQVIAALAGRQWGVVTRKQLIAAGMTPTMIHRRRASGRLLPVHRGVYAVGHPHLRRAGRRLAALLAVGGAGETAALSHRTAAALHGIARAAPAMIEVTTSARGAGRLAGVRIHRTNQLTPEDLSVVDGLPVTSVARTLVDLAGVVTAERLARAFSEADRLRLLDVRALHAARRRTRGRGGPGPARLDDAIAEHRRQGTTLTRSSLEDAFLTLLRDANLPRPTTNAQLAGYEVDAYWPRERLVVELDGWEFHQGRGAFQRDRTKANALLAAGYTVLRFTHDDVVRGARDTIALLRGALGATPRPAPAAPA